MKKHYVIGIIILACVFSISEASPETALTPEQEHKAAKIDSLTRFYHEQGKLDYDDDLQKYLPELKYEGITIRHLLWHTSGIPSYMDFMPKHGFGDDDEYINDDVLKTMAKHHPEREFEPGEQYEYSNTGYLLLASVVERASGVPFNSFLQQNIFDELGMSSSTIPFGENQFVDMPNRVRGYNKKKDGGFVDNDYVDFDYDVYGDGGMFSNVIDLFKWSEALATEKLVSEETIEDAYKPYVLNDGSIGDYGFGWSVSEVDANKVVEHSGSWIGFRTYILRDITNNHCIIVLTNLGNRKGARLYSAFYNILMDKPYLRIIDLERNAVETLP